MAVSDQQKLDFLLKKIGYTKTKTGSTVGTGAVSGTPKQPFAEALPSPLVVPNSSLWNEADSIPATPPGSDTNQVKVYSTTSAVRMTADATSSGNRAYIAYSTYNDTSSARLTNWIDTQFGSLYLIKVFKNDPTVPANALSAGATNENWFFDYSAGVLNFNDTNVPTHNDIYIVGYRYIGQTGAPTSGISTFSFLDLAVERNLDVGKQGGISTFREGLFIPDDKKLEIGNAAGNGDLQFYYDSTPGESLITHTGPGVFKIEGNTSNNIFIRPKSGQNSITAKPNAEVELYYNGVQRFETTSTGISITGNSIVSGNVTAVDATFTGNVSIAGTLTYEDAKNVDSVGLITARSGIRVTGGVIEAQAGENKIPSLYAAMGNLPSAGSYHGMFAHVHATGRGYFAHAGNWLELVNREINGVVGTGTETYNIGNLVSTSSTATSLNVTGVTTAVTLDVNGDLDVDGHTNLDNVNIVGVTTTTDNIHIGTRAFTNNTSTQLKNINMGGEFWGGTAGDYRALKLLLWDNPPGGTANSYGLGISDSTLELQSNHHISFFAGGVSGNVKTRRFHITSGGDYLFDSGTLYVQDKIGHYNDANTNIRFPTNDTISFETAGVERLRISHEGYISVTNDLDVDGHTNLDNVSVAGVSTFAGAIDLNADLDVDGHTNLDNVSIAGVSTFTGAITANGAIDLNSDLDVDGHTNLDNVSIAGVTTFAGAIDLNADLDVDGHTNLDNVSVAGVTTFTGTAEFDATAKFDSTITAGGGTGTNGQYLKTTGSGVEWATFPSLRTSQTFTASAGQTTFNFTYTVGLVDVFVNGIKLANSEYTATNGSTVVLAVGSFVGDIVELNNYNTVSAGGGAGGISNLVEDTTPQLGGNLDLFNKSITGTGNVNITGIITATNFIGNGSGLTGIVASGSGVVIKNSGSTVGTAGTINFGDNLSVSPASAGIVTITAVGITTNSGVISIENDLDVDGHTNLDNVSIAGVATVTGALRIPDGAKNGNRISVGDSEDLKIYHNGGHNYIDSANGNLTIRGANDENAILYTANGSIELFHDNVKRFETSSVGVSIPQDLDVDGHTNLDNVSIAGVTTFTGVINGSQLSLSGTSGIRANSLNLLNAAGSASYAVFTNGGSALLKHNNTDRLETSASGVTVTGTVSATAFSGDGSALTGISGVSTANVRTNTLNVIGVSTVGVLTVTGNADIDGHTELDNVNISGVATFRNPIDALDVINATNIKRASGALQIQTSSTEFKSVDGTVGFATVNNSGVQVTGVITATTFVGDGSGLTGITASGSGVIIKNSGTTVGTAGTINFGDNLSVSAISGGAVTITGSAGVSTSQFDVNKLDVSGISTFKGNIDVNADLDVDGHTNLDNVSIAGIVTTAGGLNVSGGILDVANSIRKSSGILNYLSGAHIFKNAAGSTEFFRFASSGQLGIAGENYGSSGQVLTSQGSGSAPTWATPSSGVDVGITTSLSGSFTASAGTAATINTLTGYSANDLVVEYTIYIKNGSDFQTQKLLAMRDGTTIHSTQFAVMFSSSLLVQCDATISSGNILLRATPETGVSGSTTYKIKREVM